MLEYAIPGKPYWEGFLAELERRQIPYINPIPDLVQRQAELEEDPSQGELYFRAHLSSVGNGVLARTLFRWLERAR